MGIYVVKLSEWFPFGNDVHETARTIVALTRCRACGDRVRWNRALGHHSLPWGNGDLWCSDKCLDSGKTAKADRRLENRWMRKIKNSYFR